MEINIKTSAIFNLSQVEDGNSFEQRLRVSVVGGIKVKRIRRRVAVAIVKRRISLLAEEKIENYAA